MTIDELKTLDLTMPIEEFFAIGYYKWSGYNLKACFASDKSGNIFQFSSGEKALQGAKALAVNYCKEDCEDGTIYCSLAMKIKCGGGREPVNEDLAYFTVKGAQTTRDEIMEQLERLRNERGREA